jgi:hypothetical protein
MEELMKTGRLLRWQAELVQGAMAKIRHSAREESTSRE